MPISSKPNYLEKTKGYLFSFKGIVVLIIFSGILAWTLGVISDALQIWDSFSVSDSVADNESKKSMVDSSISRNQNSNTVSSKPEETFGEISIRTFQGSQWRIYLKLDGEDDYKFKGYGNYRLEKIPVGLYHVRFKKDSLCHEDQVTVSVDNPGFLNKPKEELNKLKKECVGNETR